MLSRPLTIMTGIMAFVLMPTVSDAAASKVRKTKPMTVAYVSQPAPRAYVGTDRFPPGPIYFNLVEYLGDDPDPFIRLQLWRDLGAHFGGSD